MQRSDAALRAVPPAPAEARPPIGEEDATRAIEQFLERLGARVLRQHVTEALLAAAVATLLVTLALLRLASSTALVTAGLAAAVSTLAGWLAFRTGARCEPDIVARAEAGHPALRNLLVTERELAREPDRTTPRMRARVRQDAARALASADAALIIPPAQLARSAMAALVLFAVAAGLIAARERGWLFSATDRTGSHAATNAGDAVSGSESNATPTGAIGTIAVTVTPPAYAGRPPVTQTNPTSVTALAGSTIALAIDADAVALDSDFAGTRQALARDGGASRTRFTGAIVAQETGVLTIAATNGDRARPVELARRIIAIAVTPDQPPTVRLTAPAKDLLFPDNSERVTFQAEASDDIGLRALTLHYTKVSGSGERYEFTEGELPFAVSRQDARRWRAETARTLASLEINEGDTFVYYAAATDQRPGQPRAVSDSFVIEIGKGGLAIAGGFAIPPDEDQFAISLNALIQKTEKLHAQRPTMARAAFAEASLALAVEQRMVRSEFLFSMGSHGHVQDEQEEAEHSDEIQAGRLANRGQAELSEATRQMTRAEQHLTNAETAPALTAQRAALAAVQRAMSRQRYFLRTLAVGGTIDPTRRLTGNLDEAKPGARPEAEAADSTRANRVRAALQAIASLNARVADADADGRSTARAAANAAAGAGAGSRADANAPAGAGGDASAGPRPKATNPAAGATRAADAPGARTAADDARLVAGQVLALDPASAALRGASQQLLDAARALDARDIATARPLMQQATDALLPLLREASAPATGATGAADRRLRGARLDSLRGGVR